jgi:hypothetical protein
MIQPARPVRNERVSGTALVVAAPSQRKTVAAAQPARRNTHGNTIIAPREERVKRKNAADGLSNRPEIIPGST